MAKGQRWSETRRNKKYIQTGVKTLKGLSIVQVDRLAKENHVSYGQMVAGWYEDEKERAAAGGTATTRKGM